MEPCAEKGVPRFRWDVGCHCAADLILDDSDQRRSEREYWVKVFEHENPFQFEMDLPCVDRLSTTADRTERGLECVRERRDARLKP